MRNKRAKSFLTITIIIAVVTLLLRFGIQRLIETTIEQNESNAQATLKFISAALEKYAEVNKGAFPVKFSELTQNAEFRYLDKDYISLSPIKGYNYTCSRIDASGYNCAATPDRCNLTGRMNYAVSTGGLFVSEKCSKKE